jgi:glycine cleavage system H protein
MAEELLYSKTHEWVRVGADAAGTQIATVGLTAFALEALTDLVFVELPEVGRQLTAGEPFGEIESVKAVSDLYSPVDGEVLEVNSRLAENLENLASDPYQAGWFIKIKISDESGLAELLDEAAYKKQCEEEAASHE